MPDIVETPQGLNSFGLAQGDITPPVGMYHRMWGAAAHDVSTGIHRPLRATATWIGPRDNPEDGLALVAIDHCVFWGRANAELLDHIASRAGLERDRLMVAFSHTHGAGLLDPDRVTLPGGDQIAPYLDTMAETIVGLIAEAKAGAQPAVFTYGSGHCNLAAHRDYFDEVSGRFVCGFNPGAFSDDTVVVARVNAEDGRLLATFVNYACHPTTLAWQNTLISPDFPGATREVVEQATGAPCVFLQGASGDLGPREGFVGDPAIADRNGRQLGYAALSTLESLPPPLTRFAFAGPVESGAVLGPWHHVDLDEARKADLAEWKLHGWVVPLPYRPDLPTVESSNRERERWLGELQTATDKGDADRAAKCRAMVERMDRQLTRFTGLPPGPNYPFLVRIWKAGDALWVAIGGEHYQYLQVELRKRFPTTPIVVMSLIDDWRPGYLPTAPTYGKAIYQEIIAILDAGSLEQLTEAIGDQIQEWV